MAMRTTSPFKVTGWDSKPYEEGEPGPSLFRVAVSKIFEGDLKGESRGELLMCMADGDNIAAGAGYVISERVVGSLGGRAGSFVLQHWGVSGGAQGQHAAGHIVPGSGTGDLAGLTGRLEIVTDASGKHALMLEYEFGS
jgi:hypothetical protein